METAIKIEHVIKTYSEFQLSINQLEIPTGKITGLIGENGAGKSTLINLILNQIKREHGNINVLGLDNIKNETEFKGSSSVLLEENHLPEMFKIPNIEKMMSLIYLDWDTNLFNQFLSEFKLPINKPLSKFSRGMKVKLNFAVALAHHPKLLIIDESTSGLDPIIRKEILAVLTKYSINENLTVFLSSHILSDLEKNADYFIFIHKGQVVLKGNREDLLQKFIVLKKCKPEDMGIEKDRVRYILSQDKKNEYLIDISDSKIALNVPKANLEEILLFHVKGDKL